MRWKLRSLRARARSSSAPRRIRAARCRSEEHTSELQSQSNLECRLLLEKNACFQLTAKRRRQRGKILGGQLFGLLTDREQHLLLPLRSPEVALQVAVPGAHVLHGMYPIEMLRPAEDSDTLIVVSRMACDV